MLRLICIYLLIFCVSVVLGVGLKCLSANLFLTGYIVPYFAPLDTSLFFNQILKNNAVAIFTGFWGGLFAGIWGYYYQSKQRNEEKRADKYFDHRNAIVQIEHEMIPIRINLSRNLSSLKDALQNTHQSNTRLILRFFQLTISPGLNLKMLNLEIINQYAELSTLLEIINSDFHYTSDIVNQIRNNPQPNFTTISLEKTYVEMLPYLKQQCDLADQKTLELLTLCKLSLTMEVNKQKEEYIKNGGEIKYFFSKDELKRRAEEVIKEETLPYKDDEPRPKFIALFLDIQKRRL